MSKKDKGGNRARVEALEARLDRIEAALAGRPDAPPDPPGPDAAEAAEAAGLPAGGAARVRLDLRGGPQDWRRERALADLQSADWSAAAPGLAALGHPRRLAILRQALDGPVTAADLSAASSGQLYHHLRELTAAGWLRPQGRGRYALAPGRAGPLLAAMALALPG